MGQVRFPTAPSTAFTAPFAVQQFEHVLGSALYRSLEAEFPKSTGAKSWALGLDRKSHLNSYDLEFWAEVGKSQAWSALLDQLTSGGFWPSVMNRVYPILLDYRERQLLSAELPNEFVTSLESKDLFQEVATKSLEPFYQYSWLSKGDFNSPHCDEWRKLVSIIMYFPPNDWRESYGGGTLFFEADGDFDDFSWYRGGINRVPQEEIGSFRDTMKALFKSSYTPDTWIMFCKSRNSFHTVSPLNCPPNIKRKSFVLGLKYVT